MASRSHSKAITFHNEFRVGGFKKTIPAGTYLFTTEEVLLEGGMTPAYRRTQTTFQLPPGKPGTVEWLTISPCELDAAILRDQARDSASRHKHEGAAIQTELHAPQPVKDQGMLWIAEDPYGGVPDLEDFASARGPYRLRGQE